VANLVGHRVADLVMNRVTHRVRHLVAHGVDHIPALLHGLGGRGRRKELTGTLALLAGLPELLGPLPLFLPQLLLVLPDLLAPSLCGFGLSLAISRTMRTRSITMTTMRTRTMTVTSIATIPTETGSVVLLQQMLHLVVVVRHRVGVRDGVGVGNMHKATHGFSYIVTFLVMLIVTFLVGLCVTHRMFLHMALLVDMNIMDGVTGGVSMMTSRPGSNSSVDLYRTMGHRGQGKGEKEQQIEHGYSHKCFPPD